MLNALRPVESSNRSNGTQVHTKDTIDLHAPRITMPLPVVRPRLRTAYTLSSEWNTAIGHPWCPGMIGHTSCNV
jgi:hypothetical protein